MMVLLLLQTSQLGPDPPAPIPMPSETVPGQSLAFGGDANFAQEQDPVSVGTCFKLLFLRWTS